MNNESSNVKLSWRERIAFGQIDLAGLLVYNMITVYLSYFLTDVAMIPIGVAGAIMLIARIFDAVDAPIWGVLIDITDTRWGKARPYFLWIIFPFTLFGILGARLVIECKNNLLYDKLYFCKCLIHGVEHTFSYYFAFANIKC